MRSEIAAVLLTALVACSSDEETPALANTVVPSKDVLCYVWAGNGIETAGMRGIPVYGTLDTDVIAAWGQPDSRDGSVWTYEWCVGDCSRKAKITLTFEERDLCYSGGKSISGLWVSDIEGEGISGGTCWLGDLRNREPTCDGCLEKGDVYECPE